MCMKQWSRCIWWRTHEPICEYRAGLKKWLARKKTSFYDWMRRECKKEKLTTASIKHISTRQCVLFEIILFRRVDGFFSPFHTWQVQSTYTGWLYYIYKRLRWLWVYVWVCFAWNTRERKMYQIMKDEQHIRIRTYWGKLKIGIPSRQFFFRQLCMESVYNCINTYTQWGYYGRIECLSISNSFCLVVYPLNICICCFGCTWTVFAWESSLFSLLCSAHVNSISNDHIKYSNVCVRIFTDVAKECRRNENWMVGTIIIKSMQRATKIT